MVDAVHTNIKCTYRCWGFVSDIMHVCIYWTLPFDRHFTGHSPQWSRGTKRLHEPHALADWWAHRSAGFHDLMCCCSILHHQECIIPFDTNQIKYDKHLNQIRLVVRVVWDYKIEIEITRDSWQWSVYNNVGTRIYTIRNNIWRSVKARSH